MTEDKPALLRPTPRRHYDLTPTSSTSSIPSTPSRQPSDDPRLDSGLSGNGNEEKSIKANRSILNLTSSTLFGIYTPSASGYDTNREEPSTPWGNGSQTPARSSIDGSRPATLPAIERPQPRRSQSHPQHFRFWKTFVSLSERVVLLFIIGVAYGVIISHLHDSQQVAPVQIESMKHGSWVYLMGWGGVGVLLGRLLPWIDVLWEEVSGSDKEALAVRREPEDSRPLSSSGEEDEQPVSRTGSGLGADWNPVVRSIGAFIGIAFAIRKLPWQSTSQVSLTLALVNPVLWYLVDRSKSGFLLSVVVGLAGTAIAFGVNPEIVPSPAAPSPQAGTTNVSYNHNIYDGLISNESIGVGTWIASVLFCSSVCFGNIGRRLALGSPGRRPSVS